MVPPPASLALNQLRLQDLLVTVTPYEIFIPVVLTTDEVSDLSLQMRVQFEALEREGFGLVEMDQKTVLVLVHETDGQEGPVFVVFLRQRHAVEMRVVVAVRDQTGMTGTTVVATGYASQSLCDFPTLWAFGEEGESAIRGQFRPWRGERAKDVHPFILPNIFEHAELLILSAERTVGPYLPPLALVFALVALPPNFTRLFERWIEAIFMHDH